MGTDLDRKAKNYDRVAWFYEKSARIYSTDQIRKSKRAQLQHFESGAKVLYLGVGSGEDALGAASRGAQVTCIDISQQMIDRLQRKLDRHSLSAELICGDAFAHDRFEYYDVVATNYFLNCFKEEGMQKAMTYAAKLLAKNGKFMIADVALAQGNLLSKAFNIAYLKFAMASFWSLGLVPLHRNYDYPKYFSKAGLELDSVEYFRFLKKGPVLFQNIVATRAIDQAASNSDSSREAA